MPGILIEYWKNTQRNKHRLEEDEKMPSILINEWKNNSYPKDLGQGALLFGMQRFFEENKSPAGSEERLQSLLTHFPQNNEYIIAGSWAVELETGKKLEHTDIDIILTKDHIYLDDATIESEKCSGIIPFEKNYFKKYTPEVITYKGAKVAILDPITQLNAKLIGELEYMSKGGLEQMGLILNVLKNKGSEGEKYHRQINSILNYLTPAKNTLYNTTKIIDALNKNKNGRTDKALDDLLQVHSLIQKELQEGFNIILNKEVELKSAYVTN